MEESKFKRVLEILNKIFFVMFWVFTAAGVVAKIIIAIKGGIIYSECGGYPRFHDFQEIFAHENWVKYAGHNQDPFDSTFDFMNQDSFFLPFLFLYFGKYLLAQLSSENRVRGIICTVSCIAAIVAFVYINNVYFTSPLGTNTLLTIAVIIAGVQLLITIICSIGTRAGFLLVITGIVALFDALVIPLILYLVMGGLAVVLLSVFVIAVIVFVIFFRINSGSSSSSSSSSYSSSSSSSSPRTTSSPRSSSTSFSNEDREMEKIRNRIDTLNNSIKDRRIAIQKHIEGKIGYSYVDEKATQSEIDSEKEEIALLEKQLKRLEKKNK